MLNAFIDRCCRWINLLIALALAVMVAMVFGNVVLRYGFNSGIAVSEELSRWLFVWMTFLGAVVALNERAHLGTDSLISRLPPGAWRTAARRSGCSMPSSPTATAATCCRSFAGAGSRFRPWR